MIYPWIKRQENRSYWGWITSRRGKRPWYSMIEFVIGYESRDGAPTDNDREPISNVTV